MDVVHEPVCGRHNYVDVPVDVVAEMSGGFCDAFRLAETDMLSGPLSVFDEDLRQERVAGRAMRRPDYAVHG